jgi:hypothetical protein
LALYLKDVKSKMEVVMNMTIPLLIKAAGKGLKLNKETIIFFVFECVFIITNASLNLFSKRKKDIEKVSRKNG